jgi:putative tryptophan/tyrosine transport system substrate-binding protein
MNRRQVIAGMASAAALPVVARGQQSAIPVIGFLGAGVREEWKPLISSFQQGLREAGFIEGQNVELDYRWAENQYDRLPELAGELVRRHVAVIFAGGNTAAALAAKTATSSIPVVFTVGVDPVNYGLVASLNQPGSNVTGVSFLTSQLAAKQLEALHLLLPNLSSIGVIVNPANPYAEADTRNLHDVARTLGQNAIVLTVGAERDLEAAFMTLVKRGATALHIPGDAFYWTQREKIVALASRHALPTIYAQREFVEIGGLMSYGSDVVRTNRLAGIYVARILKGEKPPNLPVQQVTTVEFIINLKTAKALGLTIPLNLLGRADEVIE